jgi:hypothetical protein
MDDKISPKYLMKLIDQIENAIWTEYTSYKKVKLYIEKWQIGDGWNDWNFHIWTKDNEDIIDLPKTLHSIDGSTLLKMAIDLGVDTLDFIPCIPTFKNELKENYKNSFDAFEKALKQIEEHPDIAIGLANSSLESIIKEILKDDRINTKSNNKTLYDLTKDILKEFEMFPNNTIPEEIKHIGSSFLKINQSIEKLRSEKTNLHGKTNEDYIVDNPLYAYFIVNSVTTVGMFLSSFYKLKFPQTQIINVQIDSDEYDLPF